MKAIEDIIKTIFGEPGFLSNLTFPGNKDGSMGDVSMANWHCWRVLANLNFLIEQWFLGQCEASLHAKWNEAVDAFTLTLKVCLCCGFLVI
jgi:hypothetical protein